MKVNDFDYIEMPSAQAFYDEYMATLTPVVIKDLFKGEEIRNIKTREKAIEALCDMEIEVQDEYISRFAENVSKSKSHSESEQNVKPTMKLGEYFNYVDNHEGSMKMCMEFPSPEVAKAFYKMPALCQPVKGESDTLVNQCFVGNKGNSARIHFDKGGTHGFLYQVFGQKRFIVWPHKSAQKLATFTQFGAWAVDRMNDEERRAFLTFTGGQEVILNAGDCMFVPALCWHYADYVEDSMAISIRFRRPNYITTLANTLFPDMFYQGIAQKIGNQKNAVEKYAYVMDKIEKMATIEAADGVEKVKEIRKQTKALYQALYPNDYAGSHLLFELEDLLPPLLPTYLDADHPKRRIMS